MRYDSIQTVKDYLDAVALLKQGTVGDDYREASKHLASLASKLIFRAIGHQVTGRGHRDYKLDGEVLLTRSVTPSTPIKDLPIVLVDPGDYDLGSKVSIFANNHLSDRVVAIAS
ncbi:MAG TPA: hypothetical protein VHA12_00840 [Candidatus Nanoarchaeia archaeon]|nr:hypothetical protein [Candidatus Nanoarchaeia archaeon]